MVVNTFLTFYVSFFWNTALQLSWSFLENQVSSAWNSMPLYGEEMLRCQPMIKHLDVNFKGLPNPGYCTQRKFLKKNTSAFKNRNGPNNWNGPGITGMDLSFPYFFSFPIFIFLLFSSYLYACRRPMHMLAKIA